MTNRTLSFTYTKSPQGGLTAQEVRLNGANIGFLPDKSLQGITTVLEKLRQSNPETYNGVSSLDKFTVSLTPIPGSENCSVQFRSQTLIVYTQFKPETKAQLLSSVKVLPHEFTPRRPIERDTIYFKEPSVPDSPGFLANVGLLFTSIFSAITGTVKSALNLFSSSKERAVEPPLSSPQVISPPISPVPVQNRYLNMNPHLQNNIQTILEFPEDGSAMIKSINGKLIRGEGLWNYYNSLRATQLDGTILVIFNTFGTTHQIFQDAFSAVEEQQTVAGKMSLLRALCDAFAQERKLLKGLENIKKVYEARYQDNPKHKGLEQLNELYRGIEKKIDAYGKQYEALIQSLMEQSPEADLTPSVFQRSIEEPTIEQAAENLGDYCDKYCPGVPSAEAAKRIQQGQQLLKDILSNDAVQPDPDPAVAQAQLASITWFMLYTWGLQTKRGAREAVFVIEEGSKLYQFMLLVQGAYPRTSSHFIGRSPPTEGYSSHFVKSSAHHGLDINKGLLPAQKRTILFEMVDSPLFINPNLPKKVLFFKPENWGTQGTFWQHSIEYIESVRKKGRAKGEDDALGMQKERVPDNAKKAFITLLDHIRTNEAIYTPILTELNPNIYNLSTACDKAKSWGIAYMHAFISGIENHHNCPAEFNAAAQSLREIIRPLPHPDRQTGRELYITAEELQAKVFGELQLV